MTPAAKKPQILTREQMHQVIERGESVMMPDGRICSSKDQLPSEGEIALATGDTERQEAAVDDLRRQIEKLQDSLAELQRPAQLGPTKPSSLQTVADDDDDDDDDEEAQASKGPAKADTAAAAAAEEAEKARERQALLTGGPVQPPAPTQEPKPESTQGSLLPSAPAGPAKPADKGGKK